MRESVHSKPREPLAKNTIDVEVEGDARRCFEQCAQHAWVCRGPKPAPVLEQVDIGVLAGETAFLDRDDSLIGPLSQGVRFEGLAKSLVVSFGRLRADAGARAPFDLPREAWTRAALEAEQAPAQLGLVGEIAQRLTSDATRAERTVQAVHIPRLDDVGAHIIGRRRRGHDPQRDQVGAPTQTLVVGGEQRFDEL